MHTAPSNEQKHLFLESSRIKIYAFGLLSTLILFAGNLFFIRQFPYLLPVTLVVSITVFYLCLSYAVGFLGKSFDFRAHVAKIDPWLSVCESAKVDIFLPICREPIDVIENTWRHIRALALLHPRSHVYVLDDGKDPAAQTLAAKFGFTYITRETNELKKAGNLRHAFVRTSGEFIVIFDADFCPRRDFLLETLPYFFIDPNVAIVQTPQFFDVLPEYGWIRRGAGAVQELFYRLIQVNRNSFGGAICVGTNAVYRRKHLEPFGGTAPMPYSEDVHTGFQLLSNGNSIVYLPINLALGMCPDQPKQFFTQQYRWALGSISLLFSRKFWAAPISRMQRVCYLTGMFFYISTGLATVTYFLPSLFILTYFPEKMHWYNLIFSVPSFIFSYGFMRYWMKLPMNMDVIRVRHLSYFAHLFALKDFLCGTLEEWKPTGAATKSSRYESCSILFIAVSLFVPAVTFGLIAMRISFGDPPANFALLTFFTLFNSWVALPILRDL